MIREKRESRRDWPVKLCFLSKGRLIAKAGLVRKVYLLSPTQLVTFRFDQMELSGNGGYIFAWGRESVVKAVKRLTATPFRSPKTMFFGKNGRAKQVWWSTTVISPR